VGRVHDDREVGLLLQHRHGADVEREAGGALERLDPALAEDHARIPLLEDVLGGHQKLLDRGGGAALEQHGLVGLPDLREQVEVLHVARADLEHVGRLHDLLHLARVHHLGREGQPGVLAGLCEDREALGPEALEAVGRGARLEGAAAQHGGSGGRHGTAARHRLLA
jgi:hypothetical protein